MEDKQSARHDRVQYAHCKAKENLVISSETLPNKAMCAWILYVCVIHIWKMEDGFRVVDALLRTQMKSNPRLCAYSRMAQH